MRSPSLRYPMFRAVLALAFVALFEGCGGGDGAFTPSEGSPIERLAPSAATPAPRLAGLAGSERIVFGSLFATVYTMDLQGAQRHAMFTHAPGARAPAWSWDNTKVAMVSARTSNGVTHDDIYVMNADGTENHWARSQASIWDFEDPSWFPNGSRILVTVKVAGTTPTLGWLEPASGNAGLFYYPGAGAVLGSRPTFNKAGTKILFLGPNGTTIEQINPDGSGHKTRVSAGVKLDYPSFSPDGGRIAYQKTPAAGRPDIFVKNLATGAIVRLTSASAEDVHPSWSPDGTRIAFGSKRTGVSQVFTMNAATGGDLVRLGDNYTADYDPAWSH